MNYRKNMALRIARSPWMLITWFSYPLLLTYISYLSFGRSGGFEVNVGVVVPPAVRNNPLLREFDDRSLGPFRLHYLEDADPKGKKGFEDLSAVLIPPKDIRSRLKEGKPIDFLVRTNPKERIKPAILQTSLETITKAVNIIYGLFGKPIDRILQNQDFNDLNDSLETTREIYQTIVTQQPVLRKIRGIRITVTNLKGHKVTDEEQIQAGRRIYAKIFWVMFLANLMALLAAQQNLFLEDLHKGMGYRWLASPKGLISAYHDTLVMTFIIGLGLVVLGWGIAVGLLGVPPSPVLVTLFVCINVVLIDIGLIQFGYRLIRSPRAARAFIGIAGIAIFFMGGGLVVLIPDFMGSIGPYLPMALGIHALIQPAPFPWLMLVECLPVTLAGIAVYQSNIKRVAQ